MTNMQPVALDSRGWNTLAGYGDIPVIPTLESEGTK